ncbi:O-antigen ligase family protein [Patescibacteria group bacterium]|nr:O-antigen ligase family protein [Patescibacteria group bacterium]
MSTDSIRKWLEKAIKWSLLVVPFIPLYIAPALFFPYITGKAFAFRAIVEIVFFAWVFLAILYKEYRPKWDAVAVAIAVWLGVVSLAAMFGINPVRSFWSNFERMEGVATYIHLFAYFLVIASVLKKKDWTWFFNAFLIGGFFENVYVLLQWAGLLSSPQGGFRADGTIGNPEYVAAYLIFIAAIAAIMWLKTDHAQKTLRALYLTMGLWTLASIYFTVSRGPVIGLIGGAFCAGALYLILKRPQTVREKVVYKMTAGIVGLMIVVPMSLWLMRGMPFIKNSQSLSRLTSYSFTDGTVAARLTIWGMSLQGVRERPLLGWGPENYITVFSRYYQPSMYSQEPWFDRSHNIVFDWLINAGILGLASYLSLFGAAFYLLIRAMRKRPELLEEGLLIFAVFLAYFFQNLFVFDNLATYICFFAFLAYIASIGRDDFASETVVSRTEQPSEELLTIAAIGSVLVFLGVFYFMIWSPLMANYDLLAALKAQATPGADAQTVLNDFTAALSWSPMGKQEIREQFSSFAQNIVPATSVASSTKDEVVRQALAEDQKSVMENPTDPRVYLVLGSLYDTVGQYDQAIAIFQKAKVLSPEKQQIDFEIADAYFKMNDYTDAITLLEKTLAEAPDFSEARMNLVAAYILSGQQSQADQLLMEGYGTVNVSDTLLAQVYSKVKDYNRLVGVWQAFVKNNPQNLDYRKNLAGAYLLVGNRPQAAAVLQQAIVDFPSFQAEGQAYISQITAGQ